MRPAGSTVRARIRARDVMLALERPTGISALNVLAGTITGISAGQGPDALVSLDCGGDRLVARITRRSVETLGLAPGRQVFAVVKAVTFDRGSVGNTSGGQGQFCGRKRSRRKRMKVKRIVANIERPTFAAAKRFYRDVLGLDLLMDLGWIATYGSAETMSVQVSIASQGGSGTPVPDLSIEVDDLDAALKRVRNAGGSPSNTDRRTSHGACGASSCATRSAGWSIS